MTPFTSTLTPIPTSPPPHLTPIPFHLPHTLRPHLPHIAPRFLPSLLFLMQVAVFNDGDWWNGCENAHRQERVNSSAWCTAISKFRH